ncbi:FecR family protein [Mucilaginibacter sp. NFR10]|uniref:FecR family protein n=1 Tax=Mucilaginibacter sp. NFR10 TaxID=1566292 RepID=UPI000871A6D7|nr:FecR family protein [Mucilaginibacter sp. NFR10]SCW74666.1 FecR family protein [Mucilaginibacter sp. NFR10]
MQQGEFLQLIDKYLAGQATAAEKEQLLNFFESFQGDTDEWDEKIIGVKQELEDRMLNNIRQAIAVPVANKSPKVIRLHFFRNVAAAVILLAVSGIAVYHWCIKHEQQKLVAQNKAIVKHDVEPGDNRAVLTLANGSQLILDSAKIGLLNQSGNTSINKTQDGQVVYTADKDQQQNGPVAYNTISTPRGGQYRVVLPDGSKVWLNSASSLKFPTAFTGTERDVELTGEGYFEVAKNKAKPFNVKVKDINVAVLGTHFNIMAYNDEAAVKTTLLEGSVKLTQGNTSNLLKPGQQGIINDKSIKIIDVDTDEAVAWKNGFFDFGRANIQDIMKQLSRWYGTEVIYEGKIPDDEFVGKISRDVKLSQVLHILELSHVRFRIENKKIIVAP